MGVECLEAVKGERGYWHATKGDWHDGGSLQTLCGRGVGPRHRRFDRGAVEQIVDCPKCKERMAKMKHQRFKCEVCGSGNLTSINKRQVGRQSFCAFVCEGCGRTTDTVAYCVPNALYTRKPKAI